MIKVLVVEDEPPILRSLIKLIETTNPEFKVVDFAYNGKEAIEVLEKNKPDIVFTDVKMPIMDGIELISYLFSNYPDIITVIVSGYSDFNYAKSAIRYNAYEYLLKPVVSSLLEELLTKIEVTIKEKIRKQKLQYFNDAIQSGKTAEVLLPKETVSPAYYTILICAGSSPSFALDYHIPARDFWDNTDLDGITSAFLQNGEESWIISGKSTAEKIVLLTLKDNSRDRLLEISEQIYLKLSISRFAITMVINSTITNLNHIGSSCQLLRISLVKKIIIGHSQKLIEDSNFKNENSLEGNSKIFDLSLENNLLLAIRRGDIEALKTGFKILFDFFQTNLTPQITVEKHLKYLATASQSPASQSIVNSNSNFELDVNEAISNSFDYNELLNNLVYLFIGVSKSISSESEADNKMPEVVKSINMYLIENYTKQITMTTLSKKFGLVPTYLSKLFKTYIGMSPSDFITHLRIEKSKELMKSQPQLLVKEISILVGYDDQHYFSRLFKKETGVGPTEYKNPS